ncbi:MAG TPA: GNAT family N-acetyltransferase [Candidatus Aquilonibacter sp.]|nr:GNAT family N-acetyltransferase [Candidatus Aquilonibacter sp.]
MIVRRATIDDLDALLPLLRGYREFYEQAHDAGAERAYLERMLREALSAIFVAVDGTCVGFAQLFTTYSTTRLKPSLILEDLFVVPAARGSGVAAALLDAACAYACDIDAAGMFLETAFDNLTAQRVYERNGWTREGRFYKYNAPL